MATLAILLSIGTVSPVRASADVSRPVAERQVYGGSCPYGPCETRLIVRNNGRVDVSEGRRRVRSIVLTARQRSKLLSLVEASSVDPETLPATTTCPPAYDGQATRYVLHRRADARVFDQCFVVVPSSGVFAELDRIWKAVVPASEQ